MKALALSVWEKKIFKDFLLYLYVKSENPKHKAKIFKVFFFWLPLQPEFFMELKSLKYLYSKSASPKDHFFEVSMKSDCWFQRRSNCLQIDRQDRWTDR